MKCKILELIKSPLDTDLQTLSGGRERARAYLQKPLRSMHTSGRTPKGGICDVDEIRKADPIPLNLGFRIQEKSAKEDTMAYIGEKLDP